MSGRWGSAGGESDGDSKCVLEGHFSMKWACSSDIGTALDGGGGSGQGGGRRGGTVRNTRRMPGAGSEFVDGSAGGQQAGNGSNGWQRTAFAGTQATGGESEGLEGDEASSGDAPEGAEPASRSQVTIGRLVDAQSAANVLQAVGWWVLCTGHGTNRGATHGREGSDTTALR